LKNKVDLRFKIKNFSIYFLVGKYRRMIKLFYVHIFHSQIWLNHLMDDCPFQQHDKIERCTAAIKCMFCTVQGDTWTLLYLQCAMWPWDITKGESKN
jgi:hypothetical protein